MAINGVETVETFDLVPGFPFTESIVKRGDSSDPETGVAHRRMLHTSASVNPSIGAFGDMGVRRYKLFFKRATDAEAARAVVLFGMGQVEALAWTHPVSEVVIPVRIYSDKLTVKQTGADQNSFTIELEEAINGTKRP